MPGVREARHALRHTVQRVVGEVSSCAAAIGLGRTTHVVRQPQCGLVCRHVLPVRLQKGVRSALMCFRVQIVLQQSLSFGRPVSR